MSKRQTLADKLMNECTGVMRVDEEGNYAGYYRRWELQKMMLARGDDPKAVDIYIFCGLRGCTEWHPSVEEVAELQKESEVSA